MTLVDTHAHLDFTDDKKGWIERAKEAGVTKIICIGTSVDASKKCVEIAERYSGKDSEQARLAAKRARMTKDTGLQIYATVGIHAQDGKADIEKYGSLGGCIEILNQVQNDSKGVIAVGECGFDVHVTGDTRQVTSKEELQFQEELFEAQIKLAQELDLPLVVHCRNAWEETFELLEKYPLSFPPSIGVEGKLQRESRTGFRTYSAMRSSSFGLRAYKSGMTGVGLRGVFHSWTGDWEAAQRALSLGFYISFSGIVTFKNAPNVQEVAKKMPLDRMLLETDSPFLAPEPIRGSKNEPKNVRIVAEFVAELRNLPKDLICDITSENAGRLFGIEN